MLARFLEILLQSKSAAISAVFLIGTTGALVSATTQNGVTTITVTEATASPAAAATTKQTEDETEDATRNAPAAAPVDETTGTGSGSDCSAQAHARNDAVRTVNSTLSQDHTALDTLAETKGDKARQTAATADRLLKQIRDAAVRAIRATNTCAENDDEDRAQPADEDKADEDKNEDQDENDDNDSKSGAASTPTTTTAITFTGTDPKAIADQAVAAMTLAFNTAKTSLDALPTPTPRAARTPETRTPETHRSDQKGSDHGHGDD